MSSVLLLKDVSRETIEQVEIQLKYDSYIEKEKELVSKANSLEELIIPANFDYENLKSLVFRREAESL
jgi:tRNA uridine 5-carboxymethylaminomethyl modification enzyme